MGLKVNFSKSEAESKTFEIPPSGEYLCSVFSIEDKEVGPDRENAGKPFWAVRLKIQDGPYTGSLLFSNIMLFSGKDGTLSTLSQFLKALGYTISVGDFELPDADELEGQLVLVRGVKKKAETKSGRELPERFQPTGFKSPKDSKRSGASGVDALLPS